MSQNIESYESEEKLIELDQSPILKEKNLKTEDLTTSVGLGLGSSDQ